ncbi:MAG TPA: GreA/GreB family elongation factor [Opitutaceae bacterium]|nr:GreA/GreB family elongation factor [Opitutaceae bacterium]
MSKAFLREDDLHAEETSTLPVKLLPQGAKNYMTPAGVERLRIELRDLADERTVLAGKTDPEAKRERQKIEQRMRYLQQSLHSAEVVPPPGVATDTVVFGASVTVRDSAGVETRYRIVGVDETDLERGDVSWLSPLAQALLNARAGERVRFKTPRGETELEILKVSYQGPSQSLTKNPHS